MSYLFSINIVLSLTLALNTGILVSTTLFFRIAFSVKLANSLSFLQLGVGEDPSLWFPGFLGVLFKNVNLGNFDLNGLILIFFAWDDIFDGLSRYIFLCNSKGLKRTKLLKKAAESATRVHLFDENRSTNSFLKKPFTIYMCYVTNSSISFNSENLPAEKSGSN